MVWKIFKNLHQLKPYMYRTSFAKGIYTFSKVVIAE
jgi:hypothetical protein